MQIDISFKHPDDNKYWALFSNSEEMYELIKDIDQVLACVRNNDNQILETDLINLHTRIASILCKVEDISSKE